MKRERKQHNYSGASMLELLGKYGIGNGGFYSDWWKYEAFAKERAAAGNYEIVFDPKTVNLTFVEQHEKIAEGFEVPHPAIVLEAILSHYRKTKEYLLEDWHVRTSLIGSVGCHVAVGFCDAGGVLVSDHFSPARRIGFVGVGVGRKLPTLETGGYDPKPVDSIQSVRGNKICGALIHVGFEGSTTCANPKPCYLHDFTVCGNEDCDGDLQKIPGTVFHYHPKDVPVQDCACHEPTKLGVTHSKYECHGEKYGVLRAGKNDCERSAREPDDNKTKH